MEPRARAGKNVGKMNFSFKELNALLYAHGDAKNPLPETARLLDEILTDFIQGISFEAVRAAHHAGRQKLKFEDVEFAFRKNPIFLGKVQEIFEKKTEIDRAKKLFHENPDDEVALARDAIAADGEAASARGRRAAGGAGGAAAEKAGSAAGRSAAGRKRRVEEVLGEGDDDAEAEADVFKKR